MMNNSNFWFNNWSKTCWFRKSCRFYNL